MIIQPRINVFMNFEFEFICALFRMSISDTEFFQNLYMIFSLEHDFFYIGIPIRRIQNAKKWEIPKMVAMETVDDSR